MSNSRNAVLDFDGWTQSLPTGQQAAIRSQLEIAPDREAEKRHIANILWISERAKLPASQVARNYDATRAAFSTRAGWAPETYDPVKFHGQVLQEATKERDEETMLIGKPGDTEDAIAARESSMFGAAWNAGTSVKEDGEGGGMAFAKWQEAAKNSPSYRPQNTERYYFHFMQQYNDGQAEARVARDAAQQALPVLLNAEGRGDVSISQAVPFFRGLSPNQKALAVKYISDAAEQRGSLSAGDGMGEQAMTAIGRGILNTLGSVDRGFARDRLSSLKFEAGQAVPDGADNEVISSFMTSGNPGKPLIGEGNLTEDRAAALNAQVKQRLDDLQLESELIQLAQGKINPLSRQTWQQKMVIGASESIGAMGVIATPVGLPAMINAYRADAEEKLVSSGIPLEKARGMSMVIGAAQGALDRVSLGLLKKMPGLNNLLSKWSTNGVLKAIGRTAGVVAGETAIELTQDQVVPALVQDVANMWDSSIPDVSWSKVGKEAWAQTPDTLLTILPLALLGAGGATLRDMVDANRTVNDPAALEALGFSPSHIAAISLAADTGNGVKVFKELWKERTPKTAPVDSIPFDEKIARLFGFNVPTDRAKISPGDSVPASPPSGGLSNSVPEASAMAGATWTTSLPADQAPDPAIITPEQIEPEPAALRRDDHGWKLVFPDGREAQAGSLEAAEHMRGSLRRATSEKEALAMVGLADEIAARSPNTTQVFSSDVLKVDEGDVTRVKLDGSSEAVTFETKTASNLNAQLAHLGATSGLIQGSNWIRQDGQRILESNQTRDGVFTQVHEFAESRFRDIIAQDGGALAVQAARVAVNTGLFNPEKQRTPEDRKFAESLHNIANGKTTETEARETLVELAISDALGRRREGRYFSPGVIADGVSQMLRGNLPASMRKTLSGVMALLKAARAYVQGVFSVAAKLKRARREGKIVEGDALTTLLDQMLGIPEQRRHNEAVLKESGLADGGLEQSPAPADGAETFSVNSRAQVTEKADGYAETALPGATMAGPATFSIKAYHATPHKVDKFTLGTIGSGEGMQAFGWGIYFAESEAVSGRGGTYDRQFSKNTSEIDVLRARLSGLAAKRKAQEPWADMPENQDYMRRLDSEIEAVGSSIAALESDGAANIYTTLLDLNQEDLLDWDKPFSGQSVKIQKKLKRLLPRGYDFSDGLTGKDYYKFAHDRGDPKKHAIGYSLPSATRKMMDLGIPGIRYLDGNSRGQGEGSRNYVIFDENLVRILEENGQPVESGQSFSIGKAAPVTPAQDAEYMAAVESGDMETAQRMVDAAAKAAGFASGISELVYHGTWNEFDKFDPAFAGTTTRGPNAHLAWWFSDDYDHAKERGGIVMELYIKAGNRLTIPDLIDTIAAGKTVEKAKDLGYDSVYFEKLDDADSDSNGRGVLALIIDAQTSEKIKSADAVTRDEQGNIIPLSKRFDSSREEITFDLASESALETIARRMEAATPNKPEARLTGMAKAAENLKGIQRAWLFNDSVNGPFLRTQAAVERQRKEMRKTRETELLQKVEEDFGNTDEIEFLASPTNSPILSELFRKKPGDSFPRSRIAKRPKDYEGGDYDGAAELPGWLFGGSQSPDTLAQELYDAGLIRDAYPDTMWTAVESALKTSAKMKDTLKQYRERRAEAKQQARDEANAWAESQNVTAEDAAAQKKEVTRSLVALDGILMAAPAEVRGKVGGFVALSKLTTDKQRIRFLLGRVEKMTGVYEKWLRKEFDARLDSLIDKALKKVDTPGEKAASKVGPDAAYLLKAMDAARSLNAVEVSGKIAEIETRINSGELTAEQEALALREIQLVQLAGDWKNADAAQMAAAYDAAKDTYGTGFIEWSKKVVAKREARAAAREGLAVDTGKEGTAPERAARAEKDLGWKGTAAKVFLDLSSFQEVNAYLFGRDSVQAQKLIDREIEASNAREDEMQEVQESVDDLFKEIAGGSRYEGTQIHWRLSQPSIETEQNGTISEMQAIQATLMWAQADGKRHMEAFKYDQAFIDSLEAALSEEGKAVRKFLRERYAAEYAPLNALYRERFGANLPSHDNYAPITVRPMQTTGSDMVDPVTGVATTGSILSPGSLRTRSKVATAEPEFRDALQTYLGHAKQLAHWKAYYDLATDLQSIFGNRDLSNKIEAAGGKEALDVLRKWKDYFSQGGNRDAGASLALNKVIGNMGSRASQLLLFGKIGTLAIQSLQLGASAAEMPLGSYIKRMAMLTTGQLGWGDAIKSPYIQRRIAQAPPIVRQAMDAIAASKPNRIKAAAMAAGKLINAADALFTAGSYAILLDYHRTQGAKMGLQGPDVDTYAHQQAEAATDRIAQPTRAGARSIMENTISNPLARIGWMFASEARQKLSLAAWGIANIKKDPARFGRVMLVAWGVGGLGAALIRATVRDIKDDEDEELFDAKNWNAKRIAFQAMAGPLQGLPVVGEIIEGWAASAAKVYQPGGGIFDNAAQAGRSIRDVVNMEADWKDLRAILWAGGLFNDTAAGAGVILNAAESVQAVTP